MTIELSRPVDKNLRAGVAGLEIEISDSVMEELLSAIADRLQDDRDDSAANLLLLAMDSVARHVDALRVRSDLRAFGLIDELWKAYEHILTGKQDEKERLVLASAEMKKVLDWQRQCYVDAVSDRSVNKAVSTSLPPSLAELVQQQIAETGSLVEQEVAALKELVGGVSLETSHKAELDQQVSSAIAEQISSLQVFLNQEMSKLRQELQPGSGQA